MRLRLPVVRHPKLVIAAIVGLVLAIPHPYRVTPAWPMRLVDLNGDPIAGVATTQTWRHLSCHPEWLSETRRSAADGRVDFPERIVWASTWRQLFGFVSSLAAHGTDASFGPESWVHARMDTQTGGSSVYTIGQTPPDTLVIHLYGVCPADDRRPAKKQAALDKL